MERGFLHRLIWPYNVITDIRQVGRVSLAQLHCHKHRQLQIIETKVTMDSRKRVMCRSADLCGKLLDRNLYKEVPCNRKARHTGDSKKHNVLIYTRLSTS